MNKAEISKMAGLVQIQVDPGDLKELVDNTAFQRFEQGLMDCLNMAYDKLAEGGLSPLNTEFVRGQICMLRFVLGLPELVARECESFQSSPVNLTPEELAESEEFVRLRYNKGE